MPGVLALLEVPKARKARKVLRCPAKWKFPGRGGWRKLGEGQRKGKGGKKRGRYKEKEQRKEKEKGRGKKKGKRTLG
jgi:hypothetical protein